MSTLLAILCSPRQNGVSDTLARAFLDGYQTSGNNYALLALRDLRIIPCQACNACFTFPCHCRLAGQDSVARIFSAMKKAHLLLFASPIYFYGLPAHFKALIDRGQLFYARRAFPFLRKLNSLPPSISIFCAARKKGKLLFSGASRTLKWFLRCAGSEMRKELDYMGLENPADIDGELYGRLWREGYEYGARHIEKRLLPL